MDNGRPCDALPKTATELALTQTGERAINAIFISTLAQVRCKVRSRTPRAHLETIQEINPDFGTYLYANTVLSL